MNNIDDFLRDKEATHGTFQTTAAHAQTLKDVMRNSPNWENLPPESKESLEQLATLIARILNGGPAHPKHWNNAAGYMRLRANILRGETSVETGIATIARRLRPARINEEGGAA